MLHSALGHLQHSNPPVSQSFPDMMQRPSHEMEFKSESNKDEQKIGGQIKVEISQDPSTREVSTQYSVFSRDPECKLMSVTTCDSQALSLPSTQFNNSLGCGVNGSTEFPTVRCTVPLIFMVVLQAVLEKVKEIDILSYFIATLIFLNKCTYLLHAFSILELYRVK